MWTLILRFTRSVVAVGFPAGGGGGGRRGVGGGGGGGGGNGEEQSRIATLQSGMFPWRFLIRISVLSEKYFFPLPLECIEIC